MREFQPTILLLFVACTLFTEVYAGHTAYCTANRNGTGPAVYRTTKDCCAATREHSTTAFNEATHTCQDALGLGNGINIGRFARCCDSRGGGSHSNG
ncbi:uncharacterized protein UMAG_11444 [Mycosarcoma maydis]|uniref:Uncharacterized protein n=1 Tax=Mycosarcoma maydis TaxID=5270 RepID=A0A0D1E8I5_MYCMD|nr:uncharacterized protein UMAG_11444 [Ustilago maydis 521]KIS72119.1 hypothetical protein UMAG_11444 [Ustilago maydis 521]|eukprot:XP_011386771.1 hypothetical protein UMAG_11444 [Ustilago maydis 521]